MLQDIAGFQTAVGVAVKGEADGALVISACVISRKSDQLSIVSKLTGITSIQELSNQTDLPKKPLISLNITGKGILYKQSGKIETITPANFGQLLPGADFEDFYVQIFVSGGQSFIAVIRKTEADRLIRQFRDEGFNPVMLSLGPFPVDTILPQLNVYDGDVIFDGHIISRDEQKEWVSYRYDAAATPSFPVKIETEQIDERLILAYAAAFQLLMAERIDTVTAFVEDIDNAYREAISIRKTKAYCVLMLVVLFVLLLINFVLFSYYTSSNSQLAYQVSRSAQNASQIKATADHIKIKEQQLQFLGWDGGISKAKLTDQLAAEMPPEITWKQVEINPVDVNGSRNQKSVQFKDGLIRITGLSEKIIPVNEWMARIKTKHWAKDVQLENYSFNNELNTGQFIVNITY